ncbi:MAG: bifunctional metallophosphatase/5'-nucleotidase [Bacteroidales bacterium]|nr:bifunctional metallophosphatase/5'-nucleotidase [Bacteroidales bacterium]
MKLQHLLGLLIAVVSCNVPKDGTHVLHVLSTNDVHGTWFDSSYVDGSVRKSLFAVNTVVKDAREKYGADNLMLLDAGDCLQGDNATYYYNYVDTLSPHLFPRLVSYMGYDAIAAGNHDFETGHRVYDRVAADLEKQGIAFLAGNAFRTSDNKPYFPTYKIFKRAGLKVAVLGYTNPNIPGWVPQNQWKGIRFESLVPLVQQDVDRVRAKEKPHVVLVLIHSGTGDNPSLENQGIELLRSLRGVDLLINSHDHRARLEKTDSICLMNSGSHSKNVAHGTVSVTIEKGKVTAKSLDVELIPVHADAADPQMRAAFRPEFEAVRDFTLKPIGTLECPLVTRESFRGMSRYTDLLHTLSISCAPAQISFAAPLTYDKTVEPGTLVFNDLFSIYPFENQLFIIKMTGREIQDYLEYSYDKWIRTWDGKHVLNIQQKDDMRFNQAGWSFVERSYNFDSAGGLNYTVDITQPFGKRVQILSMAGGTAFEPEADYFVSMTSYRACGGGNLLTEGAHIEDLESRIVGRYPEIRTILYQYLQEMGSIDPAVISDPQRIGHWEFIPHPLADKALEADMQLLFRK